MINAIRYFKQGRFLKIPLKTRAAVKEIIQQVIAGCGGFFVDGPAVGGVGDEGEGFGEGVFVAELQGEMVGSVVAVRDVTLVDSEDG